MNQYYYRNNWCEAANAHAPDCICWHDEGTGPFSKETCESNTSNRHWRIKPEIKDLQKENEALKQRINRLEQSGDEMEKWLDRKTPITVRNDWTKAKENKP